MLSVIQQHLPAITRAVSLASINRIAAVAAVSRYHYHNAMQQKSIFDEEEEVISKKKEQLPDDKPWDGEEPVQHSVLRMIMDKYRAPLRVEGAARKNIPQPQLYHPQVMQQPPQEEKSSGKKAIEKQAKKSKMKQERLLNARDASIDYRITKNHPIEEEKTHIRDTISQASSKKDVYFDDWEEEQLQPRNISDLGVLSDAQIRSARARGDFDNLPGRGKPLEQDPLINNPFVDRTEYFLNRIIQRNGAAPPWVMMQMEVDTETTTFRSQLNSAFERIIRSTTEKGSIMQKFEELELGFFEKQLNHVNSRLRNYNVMCPSPVRKQLLELDHEIEYMKKKYQLN